MSDNDGFDNVLPSPTTADAAAEPQRDALLRALLDSRPRWRQFGALGADVAFETDSEGRLTFLAPEMALGWPSASLLGQPGASLLSDPAAPDPFRFTTPVRRQPTWMLSRAGVPVCMALTLAPMLDDEGAYRGVRGAGVDVTEAEQSAAAAAAALRRSEVLDHLLERMRQETLAPRMMQAVLDATTRALGCEAVAVVDLVQIEPPAVLHEAGPDLRPALGPVLGALVVESDAIRTFQLEDGAQMLACPCSTRFGERVALLAWRPPGHRPWTHDDIALAGAVGGVARIVLEHEAIQRELARQARTDPLTGLLNRRAFLEEAERRLDRLEREGLSGTLLFLDVDGLKQMNDRVGHETGDAALLLTSAMLQRTFRPSDLLARLGGDEFAIWLDGADSLTAAERADALCLAMPAELAHLAQRAGEKCGVSIGIATREPGTDETLEQMIHRADQAMYNVKRNKGGHWQVSHQAVNH